MLRTGGSATYYAIDGSQSLGAFSRSGGLRYWNIVLPSGQVVGRALSEIERRYYLKDRLGSVRVTLDETESIIEARNYYPFGLRMPGRSKYASGSKSPADFTGHHRDDASKMLYAGARYYMPALGRWMTTDPILSGNPKKLLQQDVRLVSMSPYNYAYNNPVFWTDPNGDCPSCWRFFKGTARGIGTGVKNTAVGAWNVVTNPVESGQNLYSAAVNYDQTFAALKEAVTAQVDKLRTGDAGARG